MQKLKLATILSIVAVFTLVALFPVAVAADGTCNGNGWGVNYTLEFAPGDWAPGAHTDSLQIVDQNGTTVYSFAFESTTSAPLYPGQVRIGFFGLNSMGTGGLDGINPAQDTFMQVSFSFPTRADALAFIDSTAVQFSWDGGAWVPVAAGPVTCAPSFGSGNPGYFYRRWPIH